MYRRFGQNRCLSNAVSEALLSAFLVLLLVALAVVMAGEGAFVVSVVFFGLSALAAVFAVDMVKRGYNEFPVVVTDYHMICSYPFGKRRVFDINKISSFKIIKKRLIFVHAGWPSIAFVRGLSCESKKELEDLLKSRGS